MKPILPSFASIVLALPLLLLLSCATERRADLLGSPAEPAAFPAHTIVITPDTKHVNVTGGDTVKFIVGNQSFAWNFFVGAGISSFDLNTVAPPGMLDHKVRVYVAPDPRYIGADGDGKK